MLLWGGGVVVVAVLVYSLLTWGRVPTDPSTEWWRNLANLFKAVVVVAVSSSINSTILIIQT